MTWLELFYDLVFAYAFIRVTLTAADGAAGVVHAMLLAALLWFLWVHFSVVGNIYRADEGILPYIILAAVVVIFIAALIVPFAYSARPDPADYVFAACYITVRIVQEIPSWQQAYRDPQLRIRWSLALPPPVVAALLLLAAAIVPRFVPGYTSVIHSVLLALAVIIEYGLWTTLGFRQLARISVRHWADRYAQIILIALGESVISLGTAHRLSEIAPTTWPKILVGALGLVGVAMMALAYFDQRMIFGEQALRSARARQQTDLAREAYVLLHLPMILGVLLFSLGLSEVRNRLIDGGPVSQPTGAATAILLCGGLFLYLAALLAFGYRIGKPVTRFELVHRPLLILMIPAVVLVPGLVTIALLAAYGVSATVVNRLKVTRERGRLRAEHRARERAVEEAEEAQSHRPPAPPAG